MDNSKQSSVTRRYQDGAYLDANPTWHAERSPWKAQHVVRGLEAVGLRPASLCDIGCGTGRATAHVARSMGSLERVVGFEPSADAPLHPDALGVVELRRAEAATSEERFDVAIMLDVFEHIEDLYAFLRSVRPLATHFVFHIPLDATVLAILKSDLTESRHSVGHLHYFTRSTALETLEDCGFRVRHEHFTKAAWDGPDRKPNSLMSLARRALYRISPPLLARTIGGMALLVVAEAGDSEPSG